MGGGPKVVEKELFQGGGGGGGGWNSKREYFKRRELKTHPDFRPVLKSTDRDERDRRKHQGPTNRFRRKDASLTEKSKRSIRGR